MSLRALRLLIGLPLAWWVGVNLVSLELPAGAMAAVLLCAGATLWQPTRGLIVAMAIAPAGLLFAAPPARLTELTVCVFLSVWLSSVWRPLASRGWNGMVLMPAVLFAAAASASWLRLSIADAVGIPASSLPWFLLQSIPKDHFLYSSPEPETWTLIQTLTGIGFCLAAMGLVRTEPNRARAIAWTLVGSMTVLSLATIASIASQWAAVDYGRWFLARFVHGERYTLHLADLNAAGSQYVLAAVTALALAASDRARRWLWLACLAIVVPGLWLTGSRTASLVAIGVGALTLPGVTWRILGTRTSARLALAGAFVVAIALAGVAVAARANNELGSAAQAMRLRVQFSETSARMIASAPVFGVGIGRYHARSSEFMPPELHEIYAAENAHNYYAQQVAELGVVGGALFVWFLAAVLHVGWQGLRTQPSISGVHVGLFAATIGYLLTCLTGHPLLVSEAALPFWGAFGVLAGSVTNGAADAGGHSTRARAVVVGMVILLILNVGQGGAVYARTTSPPLDRGLYQQQTEEDGTTFWATTRHIVIYRDTRPGFLALTLRAPNGEEMRRPLVLQAWVGGVSTHRCELPAGEWVTCAVPVRGHSSGPVQRIDLRFNRVTIRTRAEGQSVLQDPVSAILREVRWTPAGSP